MFYYPTVVGPDTYGYYRSAVNLVKGNGYSNAEEPPFEPFFFREPVYSYFLASGLHFYKFLGGEVEYFNSPSDKDIPESIPQSLIFLKIWQALFESLGLIFFFLLINYKLKFWASAIVSLLLAFYLPIAVFSTYLIRESFIGFLFISMTYFILLYIKRDKFYFLLVFSLLAAISILSFQVYKILPVFIFLYLYLITKKFWYSMKSTFYSGIIIIVLTLPWLIHVYQYYNDLRIVKTFGCSFTHEMLSYNSSQRKAVYYGYLNADSTNFQWNLPSKIQFSRSFNSYYKTEAYSINRLVNEPVISKRKTHLLFTNLRKTIFLTKNTHLSTKEVISQSPLIYGTLLIVTTIMGLAGVIGVFFFYSRFFSISFPIFVHLPLFFIIGSEYRRSLPMQGLLFFMAMVFIYYVYLTLIKKYDKFSFFKRIIRTE